MATYFYVAADDYRNILTGVTRNMKGAMEMMRSGRDEQTSATRLVFARAFDTLHDALDYENYFFRLSPRKRNKLIESVNPNWEDWSDDLFPAIAGMAYAEATSEALAKWLEEDGDEPGGIGARLPFAPFDPILANGGASAQSWPNEGETNWTAIS